MYVCLCERVTDTDIKNSVMGGATTLAQVRADVGVASRCCKCEDDAVEVIDNTVRELALSSAQDALSPPAIVVGQYVPQ